jgi:hypothetical protein
MSDILTETQELVVVDDLLVRVLYVMKQKGKLQGIHGYECFVCKGLINYYG